MKELATAAITGLKDQPALLLVVLINVLSGGFFGFILYEIAEANIRDNALIIELVKKCSGP